MRLRLLLVTSLLLLALRPAVAAPTGGATGPATLIADQLVINPDTSLTAEGAVEVTYGASHLTAPKLTYDQTKDIVTIDGPIVLTDGTGTVVLAAQAQLSTDLQNGILQSARLVMKDQLQLAAQQMQRVNGRYTQLARVVASACQVCPAHPTPLWEIRARRVVHDELAHQLYYDQAQFRVAGVPVFYVPRLRMPDPGLARTTGVLMPVLKSRSGLGVGVGLPYFIAIGDSRDLTLTPFLSTKGGRTLGFRYREAFATGRLSFTGALSRDDIQPGKTRGYVFGDGRFALANGYVLGFTVEAVSDRGYLLDYGTSDKDRLTSGAYLTRTKRDSYFNLDLYNYNSLRAGDDNRTLPSIVSTLSYDRRFTPGLIGGTVNLHYDVLGLYRRSAVAVDANGDGITDGRDMASASAGVKWQRHDVLANGMVVGGALALDVDFFAVRQDLGYAGFTTRITPSAAIDLRWPWVRGSAPARPGAPAAGAAADVIEPIAQLVWSRPSSTAVPNEDSTVVEFDEGNLFSFNRFPGADVYEGGLRANLGLGWTRYAPSGWSVTALAGRVIRSRDLGQFSTGSGLAGTRSDWLLATQVRSADGLTLTNRALFDDRLNFSKDELRLDFGHPRYGFGADYVWLDADPADARPAATSELGFYANWQISSGWRATTSARYDFLAAAPTAAGFGLQYRSDCAAVDLSLSRRFTSSTTVRPTTQFGLQIQLSGVGTGNDGHAYRRSCTG